MKPGEILVHVQQISLQTSLKLIVAQSMMAYCQQQSVQIYAMEIVMKLPVIVTVVRLLASSSLALLKR